MIHLKTTLRLFLKQRFHVTINILGLAVGLAASMIILMWVRYEYSYNNIFANRDEVYQVKINFKYSGVISTEESTCLPLYEALPAADSRIREICLTSNIFGHSVNSKEVKTNKEVLAVSEEFLGMFGVPIVRGDIHSLDDPYSIMLNESTAEELFPGKDPIGQFVTYDNERELKVTGIFKKMPYNATFWFHALVPVRQSEEWLKEDKDKWDVFYPRMYVTLADDADVNEVNGNIRHLVSEHVKDGSDPELFLHAGDRWYLYDSFIDGKEAGGRIEYVRLFMAIGILILVIACINYVNLATARSQRRAKEVGIRKSIGSGRSELIRQFLTESFVLTFVAFVIAVVIVQLVIPAFNSIVHTRLSIDYGSAAFWIVAGIVVVVAGILSGAYPAIYFASFQPIQVLRGNVKLGREAIAPRNVLVSTQYLISIFLLIGVFVVYEQIEHVRKREMGYSLDNLICYAFNPQIEKNYSVIKNELLNTGVVEAVSKANEGIDVDYFFDYVSWPGKTSNEPVQFSRVSTDYDFVKTFGVRIVEGRDFTPGATADTTVTLVNETAVKLMGMKDPVGQKIKTRSGELTIIGVTADVVRSPFIPVNPAYVAMLGDGNNHLSIRLSGSADIVTSLAKVNAVFKRLDPLNIDEPDFVRERIAWGFRSINSIGQLAGTFALLAIFLTCLGVVGLASFMTEQRTKELAIRKILGAGTARLLWLLSNYFVRMVLISALIAGPVSWWAAEQYLQRYSYRINVPFWVIPVTVAALLVFTLIIVLAQVRKTVKANPVIALKAE